MSLAFLFLEATVGFFHFWEPTWSLLAKPKKASLCWSKKHFSFPPFIRTNPCTGTPHFPQCVYEPSPHTLHGAVFVFLTIEAT